MSILTDKKVLFLKKIFSRPGQARIVLFTTNRLPIDGVILSINNFENSKKVLTIFKLNEVSLKGDKMLSVDNRLRLDVCKGSGVMFDEMFGEPMALTSRNGEKT